VKAVGYVRVSTDDQAKKGVSLPGQVAKVEAWCLAHDVELEPGDMFVEGKGIDQESNRGRSGGKAANRPALQAALDRVCEIKGVLVFPSLSRLARSTRDTLEIAERLEKAGANFVSLSEGFDTTTAAGKMVFRLLAVLAEFERDLIKERTRDGLAYKIETGSKCSPKVRFGSSINPDDPRRSKKKELPVGLVDNPDEQEAIALMKRLRSEGWTLRSIAAELTRLGVPTREGREAWNHSTVRKILARTA
jgi:DNA invertase Pin-like site-specific DNA recombinase